MSKRIEGYLRALDEDKLEQYHDYHDTVKRKMSIPDYEQKHGKFKGCRVMRKHVP